VSNERQRLNLRTSDEIIARIEAISNISGESKNCVGNILLAMALSGTTCGTTSENSNTGSNSSKAQETSVVQPDVDEKPKRKSGTTKNKRVSPPKTPSSQKKKDIPKGISKKEKGRRPRDLDEVIEYFRQRRIPEPVRPKAEKFFSYYEANGWVQGTKGKPLVDWKSCLTTWLVSDRCPDDWKPTTNEATTSIELDGVLKWMEKDRPEYYEKFKGVTKIDDIDGFYLDEFRGR